MYAQYWKLEIPPFENNQEPTSFFRSRTHQGALLKFKYLLESGKGAGVLCGASGTGKSYLIHMLAHECPESANPLIHVRYPVMSGPELIAWIAAEMGSDDCAQTMDHSLDRILREFQKRLRHFADRQQQPVIVIDEAHLIEDQRVFQALQLLMNFRDESPFTLLMCGQQTLLARLNRLNELDERISVKALLQPFSREETDQYITHRLSAAGLDEAIFDEAALQSIHELSSGVPRRINRLADLSLLVGFADGMRTLTCREIDCVAEEIGLGFSEAG